MTTTTTVTAEATTPRWHLRRVFAVIAMASSRWRRHPRRADVFAIVALKKSAMSQYKLLKGKKRRKKIPPQESCQDSYGESQDFGSGDSASS
jgi:hypothetical protein